MGVGRCPDVVGGGSRRAGDSSAGWQVKELQLSSSHPAKNAEASEKQLSGVKIYIRGLQARKRIPARKQGKGNKARNLKTSC